VLRAPSLVLGSVSKTKSSGAPSGALKATPSVAAAEAKLRKRCAREFSTVFCMEHCFFVFNGHIIFLAMMSYTQILLKSFASPFGVRRFDRIPLVPPASNASACDRDEWGTPNKRSLFDCKKHIWQLRVSQEIFDLGAPKSFAGV